MSDDYSLDDWGDDPFGGDLSFDSDFDGKKQGFVRSMASGFLSELKNGTIGSTEGVLRTARLALPKSYGQIFDFGSELSYRTRSTMDELKRNSAGMVDDLQAIVKNTLEKHREKLPNRIADSLDNFSDRDFSSWERRDYTQSDPTMEATTEEDVAMLQAQLLGEQTKAINSMGGIISRTMATVGGKQLANQQTQTLLLTSVDTALRAILNDQRKVQAKNDATKINLLSRIYMTNAKYYKFMEAGIHRQIAELRNIGIQTAKSDYQKTSHLQAAKSSLRGNLFNTAMSNKNGALSWITGALGMNALGEKQGALGNILSELRMGSDMASGVDINYGRLVGQQLASALIGKAPSFFKGPQGRKMLAGLITRYPKQGREFRKIYKEAERIGNIAGYGLNNGMGLVNNVVGNMQEFELDYSTYDDYLEALPAGQKAMTQKSFERKQKLKNMGKGALNRVSNNINLSQGTRFNLRTRTLSDLGEVSLWTRQSDRTLNEVLPGWFSKVHQTLEMIRTGNNDIQAERYDYKSGRWITRKQTGAKINKVLFGGNAFESFTNTSKDIANRLDSDNTLSPEAKQLLAYRLARDTDNSKGFSPYNFIGVSEDGYSDKSAAELSAHMMRKFGITDKHVEEFRRDAKGGLKNGFILPTRQGQALANDISIQTNNLKRYTPDISKQIDLLRNAGHDDVLREMGIIGSVDGQDQFNMDRYWKNMQTRLRGEANPDDIGVDEKQRLKNGGGGLGGGSAGGDLSASQELLNAIRGLSDQVSQTKTPTPVPGTDLTDSLGKIDTRLEQTNGFLSTLVGNAKDQLHALQTLNVTKAPVNATAEEKSTTQAEAKKTTERKSIIERLTNIGGELGGMLKGGLGKILENEPLMLGGLLGGLGGVLTQNPKIGVLIGGGAALLMMYDKARQNFSGDEPSDEQDIYTEGSTEPLLRARKLKAGEYFSTLTNRAIKSWKEIKGPIRDVITNNLISAKELTGKLFGPDGRAVIIKGLNKAKDLVSSAIRFLDPLGKLRQIGTASRNALYQMDVYRPGEKTPLLTRRGFQAGLYFRQVNGELQPVKGWNEILGPVYDQEGNQLVTDEDIAAGLITTAGVKIDSLKAGASKFGGGILSGLAGLRNKAMPMLDKTKGAFSSNFTPITDRLDKIYGVLCKKFGYDVDDVSSIPEAVKKSLSELTSEGEGGKGRANSLFDQHRRKKEKETEDFQTAVKDIAANLKGEDPTKPGKKKEGKEGGGMLGMFGSVMNFLKNPLQGALGLVTKIPKLLLSFLGMGLKVLPMIASGVFTVGKLLGSILTGKGVGSALSGLGETLPRGRKAKTKLPAGKRFGGGMSRILKGGAIAAGVGFGADAVRNIFDVSEGSTTDHVLDAVGTGANVVGGIQAATGIASMLGFEASIAGVGSAVLSGGSAVVGGAGTALGAAAPLLFNPITLGVAAVAGAGWLVYKHYTKGKGDQYPLRIAQYGIKDPDADLASKVRAIEEKLKEYVLIRAGKASIANVAPLEKIFEGIAPDPADTSKTKAFYVWFNLRFKPIFLTYTALLDTAGYKSFEEYDKSIKPDVYSIANAANSAIAAVSPYPYTITESFDDTPLMDRDNTRNQVLKYLEQIKTYNARHGRDADGFVKDGVTTIATEKENAAASEKAGFIDRMKMRLDGTYQSKDDLDEIARKFPVAQLIKDTNIDDLIPGNNLPLDPVNAIRLAAYGNSDNIPWRCAAVFKMERYCESQIEVIAGDARFTGSTQKMLALFKNEFRLEDKDINNWCTWFSQRFLPVCMNWVKFVVKNRGQKPKAAWITMSATSKLNFVNELMGLKVKVGRQTVSIWNVWQSPFGQGTLSAAVTKSVRQMIENLNLLVKQAKIRNPELEARSTSDAEAAKLSDTHNMGQKGINNTLATANPANGQLASNLPVVKMAAITGNTDTSKVDLSGVQSLSDGKAPGGSGSVGNDKGISVPRSAAEQLIMKDMMAAGFNDPRQIAEMLALANFESGGFKKSVESTVYKDPYRLMSIFPSKVKTLEQARQLVQQGPQAIANAVYGGRMGNTGENDGWLYRGRGFIQLTGRDNFAAASKDLGIDLIKNPELASTDPKVMSKVLVWYLKNNKRLQSITSQPFEYAANGLNPNGLPDMPQRKALYDQYLQLLASKQLTPAGEAPEETGGAAGGDKTPVPAGGAAAGSSAMPTTPIGATPSPVPSGGVNAPSPMKGTAEAMSSVTSSPAASKGTAKPAPVMATPPPLAQAEPTPAPAAPVASTLPPVVRGGTGGEPKPDPTNQMIVKLLAEMLEEQRKANNQKGDLRLSTVPR